MKKTKKQLESENKKLRKENERLLKIKNKRVETNFHYSDDRAQAVHNGGSNYTCSKCGEVCYYDGRCGDGAILTCDCNKASDIAYSDNPYNRGYYDR